MTRQSGQHSNYWGKCMIEQIALYDQALAFIRQDARDLVVHDSGLRNLDGGTGVNAWEIIAHEFEHYWRQVIGEEIAKVFGIDPLSPDVLLLTIWKSDDRPK
jgi:hypothetical protein